MKIVFITAGVLPVPAVYGGAVENLIQHFVQENEKEGLHDIVVYSISAKEAETQALDYKFTQFRYIKSNTLVKKGLKALRYLFKRIFRVEIPNQFISEVIKDFKQDLKNNSYDAVVLENKPDYIIPLRKIYGGKIYHHIHNDCMNGNTKRNQKLIELSDRIITVSDYIKGNIMHSEQNNKIVTLYNGIDTEVFNKAKWKNEIKEFRQIHGIKKDDIVIIFSGRLNSNKGVKELLQAFNKLNDVKNIKLLIVGSKWYSSSGKDSYIKDLETLSKALKDNIIFTGYIDYNRIPLIYASSDIAVVPSIWNEPAGLVVIEARASGLPLIVSDSGGIPEYVNESGTVIVKRDDNMVEKMSRSLQDLISSRELRNTMGDKSRHNIEKFDKKTYYANFTSILKELNS